MCPVRILFSPDHTVQFVFSVSSEDGSKICCCKDCDVSMLVLDTRERWAGVGLQIPPGWQGVLRTGVARRPAVGSWGLLPRWIVVRGCVARGPQGPRGSRTHQCAGVSVPELVRGS